MRNASKPIPPLFIARAGKDFAEFNRSVDTFTEEARKRRAPVEVENYPNGVHAFDIVSDTDESRAVIAKAVAFVKSHLLSEPPAVTSGHIAVDDEAKLYYEVRGKGPVVVLVHDGLLHGAAWDRQWDALSSSYKLVRYDRRGYGRSSLGRKPYSDVDDLARLVRHLELSPATLVAASAGGNLAIQYTLAHPAAVARLILVGPVVSGLAYSDHFRGRNRAAFRPLAERGDVKETIANWVKDPYLTATGNNAAKARLRELLEASPHNLTGPGNLQKPSPPAIGRLAQIQVPTLILVGESDIPDVHAHCGAIQAGVPGAKRVVMTGAGHLPFLERPDEFNRLVLDFVGGR
jgi:pimeloyl-ACP methyl ester carboxylesterase